MIENERGCAMVFAVDPLEVSIKTMPRSTEKVQLRVVKRHSLRDVSKLLRQSQHQPSKESSIRDLVQDCWTRRQRAVLDPQVWNTVGHSVARTIPTPDGPVVHSQG